MVQNVRYLNGPPSHVTLLFEYQTPIVSSNQMNQVFRLLLNNSDANSLDPRQHFDVSDFPMCLVYSGDLNP